MRILLMERHTVSSPSHPVLMNVRHGLWYVRLWHQGGRQLRARHRTVALQVVGVVVLAAITYMAFLSPSKPGDLHGIEAGEGEPPVVVDPTPKPPDDPRDRKRPDAVDPGRPAAPLEVPAPAGPPSSPTPPLPSEGETTAPPPSGDGETPTGSQYDDPVARLLERVDEPASSAADLP